MAAIKRHRFSSPQRTLLVASLISALAAGCAGKLPSPQEVRDEDVHARYRQTLRMAETMRNGGDLATAAAFYERAHAIDPDRVEPLKGLADIAMVANAPDEAVRSYGRALEIDPNNGEIRRSLARLYILLDHPDLAIEQYSAILSNEPKDVRALNGLGVAFDLNGQPAQAQEVYGKGLSADGKNIALRNNMALSLALSGDYHGAVRILSSLVTDPGASPQIVRNLALVRALANDLNVPAESAYSIKGISLSPEHLSVLRQLPRHDLARIVFGMESPEGMIAKYTRAGAAPTASTTAPAIAQASEVAQVHADEGKGSMPYTVSSSIDDERIDTPAKPDINIVSIESRPIREIAESSGVTVAVPPPLTHPTAPTQPNAEAKKDGVETSAAASQPSSSPNTSTGTPSVAKSPSTTSTSPATNASSDGTSKPGDATSGNVQGGEASSVSANPSASQSNPTKTAGSERGSSSAASPAANGAETGTASTADAAKPSETAATAQDNGTGKSTDASEGAEGSTSSETAEATPSHEPVHKEPVRPKAGLGLLLVEPGPDDMAPSNLTEPRKRPAARNGSPG